MMNLFIGTTMTVEYTAKGLLSLPLAWMYGSGGHKEPETIKALVKDFNNQLKDIDPRIQILKTYEESGFSLIELPRYKPFVEITQKLARSQVRLIQIAGQNQILFKVRTKKSQSDPCLDLLGCKKEFDWNISTDPSHKYITLTVKLEKANEVVQRLDQLGIEIAHIHDF